MQKRSREIDELCSVCRCSLIVSFVFLSVIHVVNMVMIMIIIMPEVVKIYFKTFTNHNHSKRKRGAIKFGGKY